jgi:hypothetical protein
MVNFFKLPPNAGGLTLWLSLSLLVSSLVPYQALAGPRKYKSSTVIDFEGALVEGKSRKPYSTYLSQQKRTAYSDLHLWQPDFDKRLLDSQVKLENTP